jgi:hypothetical protein
MGESELTGEICGIQGKTGIKDEVGSVQKWLKYFGYG